jgi:hypothetical protein
MLTRVPLALLAASALALAGLQGCWSSGDEQLEPEEVWHAFRADLNRNLWDGILLVSMGRVTASEVAAAHARLLSLPDDQFDTYLWAIARQSVSGDPKREFIDNYIEALARHSPEKLGELARRIATSGGTDKMGPTLLEKMKSDSFLLLVNAVATLPAKDADGGTRAAAVANLGGPEALGARLAYDYFSAVVHGDEGAARAVVQGATVLDGLVPGSMPLYVGRLARIPDERTSALISTFDPVVAKDSLSRSARYGHVAEFENMLEQELGLTAAEAYEVSRKLNRRYL